MELKPLEPHFKRPPLSTRVLNPTRGPSPPHKRGCAFTHMIVGTVKSLCCLPIHIPPPPALQAAKAANLHVACFCMQDAEYLWRILSTSALGISVCAEGTSWACRPMKNCPKERNSLVRQASTDQWAPCLLFAPRVKDQLSGVGLSTNI